MGGGSEEGRKEGGGLKHGGIKIKFLSRFICRRTELICNPSDKIDSQEKLSREVTNKTKKKKKKEEREKKKK